MDVVWLADPPSCPEHGPMRFDAGVQVWACGGPGCRALALLRDLDWERYEPPEGVPAGPVAEGRVVAVTPPGRRP